MPIGKDSITKRVAKKETLTPPAEAPQNQEEIVPIKDTEIASPSKPASEKKAPVKKPAAKTVIANISPKTVEAVIGHKENTTFKKVQIGTDLPYYLL